jgi:uncharacterized delta-60 repeat protein
MYRFVVTLVLLAITASAAQADPGDLDRTFSGDGRIGVNVAQGSPAGLTLLDGSSPQLSVVPDAGTSDRPAWLEFAPGGDSRARTVAPDPIIEIRAESLGAVLSWGSGVVYLARPDTPTVTTLTLPDANFQPSAFAIDDVGSVLIGGKGSVARYARTGALGGVTKIPLGSVGSILLNADGSAFLSDRERIAKLDANGQLAAGFHQGARFTPKGNWTTLVSRLVRGAKGTLLVAGWSTPTGPWIARLRPDGRIDTSFARGGRIKGGTALRRVSPWALAVDRHGRIVAAGTFWTTAEDGDAVVLRYSSKGVLDRSFGKHGRARFALAARADIGMRVASSRALHVAIDRLGRIVVAGEVYGPGFDYPQYFPAVARLEA